MQQGDLTSNYARQKRLARIWIGVAVGLVLLLIGIDASGVISGLGTESQLLIKVTQSSTTPENHLRLLIAPPLDSQEPGKSAPVQVLAENDGELGGLLNIDWLKDSGCIALDTSSASSLALPAHSSKTVSLALNTAACGTRHLPHSEALQFAYKWDINLATDQNPIANPPANAGRSVPTGTAGSGSTPTIHTFTGLVALGPITITSSWARFNQRFMAIADHLIEALTWPILLAVLGYLVQLYLARRAERQQIFSTLLPAYTDLVQAHYMPIVRRMQTVQVEAERVSSGTSTAEQALPLVFSAILLFRRRYLHLVNLKGAFFFRSSVAEELFISCFNHFYGDFRDSTLSPSVCEELALNLKPDDELANAHSQLFSYLRINTVMTLFTRFRTWAAGGGKEPFSQAFADRLVLLKLGQAVLNFECDRIYYQSDTDGGPRRWNWYFDPPQFEFEGEIIDLDLGTAQKFLELLNHYLDRIPAECRRKTNYPRLTKIERPDGTTAASLLIAKKAG